MTLDATMARLSERGKQLTADRDARRERMRREYPDHAALFDLFKRFEPCCVTIGDKRFGKPLPDRVPYGRLMPVSQFADELERGLIRPNGEQVVKRKRIEGV